MDLAIGWVEAPSQGGSQPQKLILHRAGTPCAGTTFCSHKVAPLVMVPVLSITMVLTLFSASEKRRP